VTPGWEWYRPLRHSSRNRIGLVVDKEAGTGQPLGLQSGGFRHRETQEEVDDEVIKASESLA